MSARQRRQPWVMQATALYDYDPEESDELALIEGQLVRVLQVQVQDDGWWLGYVADDPERVGLFPSNYVRQEHELPSPQQPRITQQQQQQKQQQRSTVQPHEANDEEDGDDEEPDDAWQQHQRRTHQRDQQQQQRYHQLPQHNDSYRNEPLQDEDEPGNEEEESKEEDTESTAPAQQRMVSVLQLKRSLADAERASDAARAARLQAERERIQQQRRRPLPRNERSVEDDDEDEDIEEQEQNQAESFQGVRQQRRRVAPGEEDDDAFQYNQRPIMYEEDDGNDDQEQDEEEEEQPVDNEAEVDGSFSVPAIHESRMKEVISAYQAQQESNDEQTEDEEEEEGETVAASRIAREYRIHQRSKQHQRSFIERQNAAALAIQRWMLRTSSQQRMRNQKILEDDRDAQDQQKQQRDTEVAAAARIQSWMRQLLAHFRWKEHVERERVAMLKRKRVKMLQLEQEARRKAEEEQRQQQEREEQDRQREEQEKEELKSKQRQAQQKQQQQRQAASSFHQSEPLTEEKARKKIMKKEAVDLVKILVKKQLDEKLREHDEKMGELQRLVTTLQDVIYKQSEMILQGSNEPLPELQIPRKITKPMQALGNQQSFIPAPSLKQPIQPSSSSASLASSSASTFATATAAKESLIPKPPSRSLLPQIGNNPAVKPVKPSGIELLRNSTDAPSTKLPVLANTRQLSSIPVKR